MQVHIITGATGVGKSKFLSQLLTELPSTSNVAVISHRHANSFGLETTTLPLTSATTATTLATATYFQVFDFGSGCLCCSPDGDLTRLLRELTVKHSVPFTHLFLETTGVADVRPFIQVVQQAGPSFR